MIIAHLAKTWTFAAGKIFGSNTVSNRNADGGPTQGGKVLQERVGDVLKVAQRGGGAPKISGVPEDDRGDEKVEP